MENLVKINLPGGFISAGDLYELLVIAENAGAKDIRFGNRQQLFFTVDDAHLEDMETEMLRAEIKFEINNDLQPNIVSSYVADSIFNQEGWVREGVYKDILDLFDYTPGLKINIVDNQQSFVPFFSGNINFIASDTSNYWYLYVRFPKSAKQYCYPHLVYSEDIPGISRAAEEIIFGNQSLFYEPKDVNERQFFAMLSKKTDAKFQDAASPLKLPGFYLPYYEGFNKYNNKYWLGVYRRNELFSVAFLKDACQLCLKSRIGQLYTTPWKSIIIKGIDAANRPEWGLLLSKYYLNVRHAANELNWQVEDLSAEGLALKKQLVREFEELDLRTYQLCFTIKMQPKTGLPGSIIIKKNDDGLYDLLHTRDFNPNTKDYIVYIENLNPAELTTHLVPLCKKFYDTQSNNAPSALIEHDKDESSIEASEKIYQCSNCLTRYDKRYGDTLNYVDTNIDFDDLPNYHCPVCEAPKSEFVLI